jgi:acyl carrier protein
LEELGINSLGAISMICELEEEFGVGMLSDDVLGIRTVGQAVANLERVSLGGAVETRTGAAD